MVSRSAPVAAWDSVGQTLAVLTVIVAVLGAALRWDLPAARQARIDRAIQNGITHLTPVKVKPRVVNNIKVQKIRVDQDNSNSSYAALGIRAVPGPVGAPEWSRRAFGRLEALNRSLTSSLKELARKSILGPV